MTDKALSGNGKPVSENFEIGALSKGRHVKSTMGRVIRMAARGELSTEDMARFVKALRTMFDVLEGIELAQRVADLEARR